MTNALTIKNNQINVVELGTILSQSGYFQDAKQAAQAVVKILAGQELGFGPIASMTGVNIIKGKVSLSANLMAAAIKKSGKYDYRIKELSDTAAELIFFQEGKEVGTSRFTLEDAQKGNLQNNANWKNYPRNMLFARAISNGARWYCPDSLGGPIYTPDELGADVDSDGEIIAIQEETPALPAVVDKKLAYVNRLNELNSEYESLTGHKKDYDLSWLETCQEAELVQEGKRLKAEIEELKTQPVAA